MDSKNPHEEQASKNLSGKIRLFPKMLFFLFFCIILSFCILHSILVGYGPIFYGPLENHCIEKSEEEIWYPAISGYIPETPQDGQKCIVSLWSIGDNREEKKICISYGKELSSMSDPNVLLSLGQENPLSHLCTSGNSSYCIAFLDKDELFYREATRCLRTPEDVYQVDKSNISEIQISTFEEDIDSETRNIVILSYIQRNSIQNHFKFIRIDPNSGQSIGTPIYFFKKSGDLYEHVYIKRCYSDFNSSEEYSRYFLFYKETSPIIQVRISSDENLEKNSKKLEIPIEDLEHYFILPDKNGKNTFLIIYTNKTRVKIGRFQIDPSNDYEAGEKLEVLDIYEFKKKELGGIVCPNSRVHFFQDGSDLYVIWTVETWESKDDNPEKHYYNLYATRIEMSYNTIGKTCSRFLAATSLVFIAFLIASYLMPSDFSENAKRKFEYYLLVLLSATAFIVVLWISVYGWSIHQWEVFLPFLGILIALVPILVDLLSGSVRSQSSKEP